MRHIRLNQSFVTLALFFLATFPLGQSFFFTNLTRLIIFCLVCAASPGPVASCAWSWISRHWPNRRATRIVNFCQSHCLCKALHKMSVGQQSSLFFTILQRHLYFAFLFSYFKVKPCALSWHLAYHKHNCNFKSHKVSFFCLKVLYYILLKCKKKLFMQLLIKRILLCRWTCSASLLMMHFEWQTKRKRAKYYFFCPKESAEIVICLLKISLFQQFRNEKADPFLPKRKL